MSFLRVRKSVEVRLQGSRYPVRRGFFGKLLHVLLWLPYMAGLCLITVVGFLFYIVTTLCHAVGLAVLWPPKTVYRTVCKFWALFVNDIEHTFQILPARVSRFRAPQFGSGLALFAGFVMISFLYFLWLLLTFDPLSGIPRDSTLIMDREKNLLYTIHGEENRKTVDSLSEISPQAVDATLAIEDDQFYQHFFL
jgi:hypothetical protein